MRVWRNSAWDALLVAYSVAHLAVTLWLAVLWGSAGVLARLGFVGVVGFLTTYNIIVVSHLFTHAPWFRSARLNALVSVLNSVNIGQSVQAYELTHVRNHHRYNNDPKGADGTTRDASSTYRNGTNGEHEPPMRYAVLGAVDSLRGRGRELAGVGRLWQLSAADANLLQLAARREPRRSRELRQIRADRAAHCLALAGFVALSWQWTLTCYLPGFAIALTLVNVQNYYRHYGADPSNRHADSVSHYGRLYNLLTFNDGFHQEHHLNPGAHWSELPAVRERHCVRLAARPRVVSRVPAVVGFLDRPRPMLHRAPAQRPTLVASLAEEGR